LAYRNKIAACVKLPKFCIYIQIKDDWIKNSMQKRINLIGYL